MGGVAWSTKLGLCVAEQRGVFREHVGEFILGYTGVCVDVLDLHGAHFGVLGEDLGDQLGGLCVERTHAGGAHGEFTEQLFLDELAVCEQFHRGGGWGAFQNSFEGDDDAVVFGLVVGGFFAEVFLFGPEGDEA